MNRRNFLTGAAAASLLANRRLLAAAATANLAPVAPLDPSRIKPSDFSDADLDMPFALAHFAQVANSVALDGPNRGFIDISVWRGMGQLHPYNARIMESILTLAWFYTAPRRWNQYRGDPAVRTRLELALEYWCNLESREGQFSEYGPQKYNLAATAFAVKFMSESLRLLRTGPPISAALHRRAIDGCRRAIQNVLSDPDMYRHGRSFSNQYTNIFAGGAAFLAMYPDAGLEAQLSARVKASRTDLQSPAGYMYEHDGPDLGYTLNTHHENLQMAYSYWRGTPLGDILIEEENRFGAWLALNIVPEPGQDFYVANRGIESRQKHATFAPIDTPLADRCTVMRAFATSPEERAEQTRAARAKLEQQWPTVDPLPIGEFEALSPYRFLQRAHYNWHPTAGQISEARKLVRPVAETRFVEQLCDTREQFVFTYVRRPAYYAAFASSPKTVSEQQRLGLTLVWSPSRGVLLQSQTSGGETAWGTSLPGQPIPFEAESVAAAYENGNTVARYPLTGGGDKRVTFAEDRISVAIEREGDIIERIPVFDPRSVSSAASSNVTPQATPVPGKSFAVVELRATGKLEYEIRPEA